MGRGGGAEFSFEPAYHCLWNPSLPSNEVWIWGSWGKEVRGDAPDRLIGAHGGDDPNALGYFYCEGLVEEMGRLGFLA